MDKIAAADPRERADLFMEVAGLRPAIPAAVTISTACPSRPSAGRPWAAAIYSTA